MSFNKSHMIILLSLTIVLLVSVRLYYDNAPTQTISGSVRYDLGPSQHVEMDNSLRNTDNVYATLARLIEQRNNLSRVLNLRQQKIGQLECEVSAVFVYG